jgi:hypothetical protein
MKWDGATGDALWGDSGVSYPEALMLGLSTAMIGGSEVLLVADGRSDGGQIHRLDLSNGDILSSFPVADVPLDVVVDADENYFVLTSATSNPLIDNDPVFLRRYDGSGNQTATEVALVAAVYIALGSDNVLYISSSDFESETRRIYAYNRDLTVGEQTLLPEAYVGYSGGIATYGQGDDRRILITAQEGVGSRPICDVLAYQRP